MTTPLPDFAAFIGLDWAEEQHDVALLRAGSHAAEQTTLLHRPEELVAWAIDLRDRFGGRPVAICLEQSRGALIGALMQFPFLVLFPLNPKQLAAYRQALYPSGAKDDATDAELLARFVRDHHPQMRSWRADDETTRSLDRLSQQRRAWVEERVAIANRLRQTLKECYVLALLWGSNLVSPTFLALLKKFPAQRDLQRASPKQLERWLPHRRKETDEERQQRIKALRAAVPITNDRATLEAGRLAVVHTVALLETLNRAIEEVEQRLAQLVRTHPDAELFDSFPGVGDALGPRLIAAFGTDREKFASAQEVQQFSGTAPVTKASGKTRSVQLRRACPKFIRQTFHEHARCSQAKSRWARAYVEMKLSQGHNLQAVLRALAFKWQRILFRCWRDNQPYDEERYLAALRKHRSPLLAWLPPEPLPTP